MTQAQARRLREYLHHMDEGRVRDITALEFWHGSVYVEFVDTGGNYFNREILGDGRFRECEQHESRVRDVLSATRTPLNDRINAA